MVGGGEDGFCGGASTSGPVVITEIRAVPRAPHPSYGADFPCSPNRSAPSAGIWILCAKRVHTSAIAVGRGPVSLVKSGRCVRSRATGLQTPHELFKTLGLIIRRSFGGP